MDSPSLYARGKLSPQKMARDRSACEDMCLAALDLLEVLEEEDDRVTKGGKTRHWISEEEIRL